MPCYRVCPGSWRTCVRDAQNVDQTISRSSTTSPTKELIERRYLQPLSAPPLAVRTTFTSRTECKAQIVLTWKGSDDLRGKYPFPESGPGSPSSGKCSKVSLPWTPASRRGCGILCGPTSTHSPQGWMHAQHSKCPDPGSTTCSAQHGTGGARDWPEWQPSS